MRRRRLHCFKDRQFLSPVSSPCCLIMYNNCSLLYVAENKLVVVVVVVTPTVLEVDANIY